MGSKPPEKEPIPPHSDTQFVEQIKLMSATSTCAKYNWKNRGIAPQGYLKGMAISFARSLCRLKLNEQNLSNVIKIMSSANSQISTKDALAHYENNFKKFPSDLTFAGENPLRAIYVLGIGLGMRESSGKYCEGWDKAAGSNRPSSAGEAGLFQTSFDSMKGSSALADLYSEYKKSSSTFCLLNTFKEGVRCPASSTLGNGEGADFQIFTKACPAFATEYAMTLLRFKRGHFGPINRLEAEVVPACDNLLKNIQEQINIDPENSCRDIL